MTKRKKKHSKQPSQVPPLDERHYLAMELIMKPYYDQKRDRNRWLNRSEITELVGVSRMPLCRWEQRKDFQHEKSKRHRAYSRKTTQRGPTHAEMASTVISEADNIPQVKQALRNTYQKISEKSLMDEQRKAREIMGYLEGAICRPLFRSESIQMQALDRIIRPECTQYANKPRSYIDLTAKAE
ncbi:hypothetical protein [Domibacillus sp.]|uniref:hypothetical protein n=1 Tax=Domibacillus sp. TaxID=1969783 RepID=UPI0028110304|nr:hypothetical protein [Domibacillus sp.]